MSKLSRSSLTNRTSSSRIHWDVGGYDYHPNGSATSPQKLDDGENLRRARISVMAGRRPTTRRGMIDKFLGGWNSALVYDFSGTWTASPAPAPFPSRSSLDQGLVSARQEVGGLPATLERRLRGSRPRVRRQVRLRFCPCRTERTRRCRDLADVRSISRQGPSGSGLPR
jgi:hypothetical protein